MHTPLHVSSGTYQAPLTRHPDSSSAVQYQAYGIRDSSGKTIFGYDEDKKKVVGVDPYERPQGSACFIISVDDDVDDIWNLMSESARLFKYGSGVGADWSKLRSTREKLSGGGTPSGPVSFMRVQDATAGTIKSGQGEGDLHVPSTALVFTIEYGASEIGDHVGDVVIVMARDLDTGEIVPVRYRVEAADDAPSVVVRTGEGILVVAEDTALVDHAGRALRPDQLAPGAQLKAGARRLVGPYARWSVDGGKHHEHVLVARTFVEANVEGRVVHHRNENPLDNRPENLDVKTQSDHARDHCRNRVEDGTHVFLNNTFDHSGQKNGMARSSKFWSDENKVKAYREKQSARLSERNPAKMQRLSQLRGYLNQSVKLLDAGYDIETESDFFRAYAAVIGRVDSRPRRAAKFVEEFGSYERFRRWVEVLRHENLEKGDGQKLVEVLDEL